MTFFLPATDPQPANPAPQAKAGGGEVFGAAWTAESIETDAWQRFDSTRYKIFDEIRAEVDPAVWAATEAKLNAFPNLRSRRDGRSTETEGRVTLAVLSDLAKQDPAKWGRFPQTEEAVRKEAARRLKAEHADAQAVLGMGGRGAGALEFLGRGARAMTDETNVALMPFGGPAGGLLRTMAVEGALGVVGEALTIPKQQEMSDLLDLPDPNVPEQLAMAGAFSAAGAGVLLGVGKGVGRGAEYWQTRRAVSRAEKPADIPVTEFDARVDEAVTALREGQPVPDAAPVAAPKLDPVTGFDWDRHRTGGGLRSDAIEGMGEDLRVGLENMITEAPDGIGSGLSVFSGYRSVETQKRLWDDALKKYGTAAEARKWVAPPGRSNHNRGEAADLRWNGKRLDEAPKEVRDWVHANAGKYGMKFPLANEPWHIEPVSTRGGAPAKAPPPKTRAGYTRNDEVSTPGGERVGVTYEVVDASLLRAASGDLQPRDRSRASSDEQIAEMAARLDPARLMPSPEADRGAPVVGPDNVVESGNGRVAAIAQAQARGLDRYDAYVETIKAAGFDIPEGVTSPVLIARRTTVLDDAARQRFVRDANTSTIARMSSTEQSAMDARLVDETTLSFHRPDASLTAPENRPFVQALLSRMPQAERNGLVDARGQLNADGVRRIRQAMFSAAYDAPDMISRFAEADGGDIRAITEALADASADWAALKADIAAGRVLPELDTTAQLLDAVRLVANARQIAKSEDRSVSGAISDLTSQSDLLGGAVDEITRAWVDVLYKGGRARSSADVAEILRDYVTEARNVGRTDPGLFGSDLAPTAKDIIDAITREEGRQARRGTETGQSAGRAGAGQSDGAQGAGPGRPAPAESGQGPAQVSLEGLDDSAFEQGAQSPLLVAADAQAADELRGHFGGDAAAGDRADLGRLIDGGASRQEIDSHPAVVSAIKEMQARPKTTASEGYGSAKWRAEREYRFGGETVTGTENAIGRWVDQAKRLAFDAKGLKYEGVREAKEATIILGPPAAGKSGIANDIAVARKAAILDSDEIKKTLPEFNSGIGANAVHKESSDLTNLVEHALLAEGANLVVPKVGSNVASIENTIARYRAAGYNIRLVNMAVSADTAYRRMIGRFVETGRLIPPEYIDAVGEKPSAVFRDLKAKNLADGYAEIDNNGGFNESKTVRERAGQDPLEGNGAIYAGSGRGGPGTVGRRQGNPEPVSREAGQAADQVAAADLRAQISENDFEVTLPDGQPYRASDLLADAEADVDLADLLNLCNPGGAR